MSENSEKGRRGEHAGMALASTIAIYEPRIEVKRTSTTNTPENGVDFEVICPHNLSTKLDQIAQTGKSDLVLSNSLIQARVQVKNHSGPITKAIMDGFIQQCATNPKYDEHWGMGGVRFTKGAKESLEAGQQRHSVKWWLTDDLAAIESKYPAVPFGRINDALSKHGRSTEAAGISEAEVSNVSQTQAPTAPEPSGKT